MDESEISQEPEFDREVTGDVGVVDVQTGHNIQFRVVKRRSAENPIVATHIGSDPVGREVSRVGVDGAFQCLEPHIGGLEPVIGECELGIDFHLVVLRQVAIFGECRELALSYE